MDSQVQIQIQIPSCAYCETLEKLITFFLKWERTYLFSRVIVKTEQIISMVGRIQCPAHARFQVTTNHALSQSFTL